MHKTLKEALLGGLLAFVLGFTMIWLAPARANDLSPLPFIPRDQIYAPTWSRATCGSVCTVTYSPGGYVDAYKAAAEQIKADNITLKIDGPCISACTMAADKARPNVCITPNAKMLFHRGIREWSNPGSPTVVRSERFDPTDEYSDDVNRWVAAHGGYPGKDTSDAELAKFLTMDFAQAKRFFKVCE